MVVGGEGVPHAILVVVVLAVRDVLCVGHGHLLATVPGMGEEGTPINRWPYEAGRTAVFTTTQSRPNTTPPAVSGSDPAAVRC